jgi:hypothetical protein
MRQSEAVQVGGQYNPKALGLGTGGPQAAPDYAKFVTGESASDRLAMKLAEVGTDLAAKAFQVETEEQYLQGVAAASAGKAEADLEGNQITGAWETAGYRDTLGKLSMAETQAKVLADMPTLVQKTPEQFKQYLDEVRAPLLSQLNGMSRQQRAATFGQLAMDMRTYGKKYEVGRTAWIVDQKSKAIQTSMTARRASMEAAKDDLQLYDQEVTGFVSSLYKDVWSDPSLPQDVQIKLTQQAAEFAASADNTMVYDKLQSLQFEFADGKKGTLMSRLPFEDQIKVDKAQRAAMDRVKALRSGQAETQLAIWSSEWADPDIGANQTFEEVNGLLDAMGHAKLLSPGKRETVLKQYFTAAARNSSNGKLAQAYMAGDVQTMTQMGKSQADGLKAYMKAIRTMPLDQQVSSLMALGNTNGLDTALTKAGELLGPAISQMGMADEMDPNNALLVQQTSAALNIAETTNPGAYSRFVSGMTDEQKDMFLYLSEAQRNGIADPTTAIKYARGQIQQDKQAGGVRSQRVADNNKEDAGFVAEITDRQLLGTISSKFSIFADATNRDQLRTGRMWFEDQSRVNEVMADTQMKYAEELAIVSKTTPFMTGKARNAKALANLAQRTVETSSGPLTMPRGQNVQSYFGVPQYADKEMVGQAIDEMYKPADGNRLAWSTSADNQLMFREYNANGAIVKSGTVDPKQVAPKVQEILNTEAAEAARTEGPGVVFKGPTGAQVQFNGLNTHGVDPATMIKLRQDIVASESVRDTAYADSGGKSFGVGIHQSNNHYQAPGPTGVYTQGQINESFAAASNDAARQAVRTMQSVGVDGEDWVRFFGELSYQSPNSARDPDLLAYISLGDKAGAQQALTKTAAYKASSPERRAQYTARLSAAMR